MADENKDKTSDEDILEAARERFHLASEAESKARVEALDDVKFSAGEQWPEKVKHDREQDARPCLVINRIPQFIQQLTNDQRQNRPAIHIHPVSDDADVETAKILQGLIRHIEYNSNADVAYDTAFDGAVRGGRGFFRFITDYTDPNSFDQEILFKRIRNQFSVYIDPYSTEPDGADMNFGFIVDDMSPHEFKEQYPKAEKSSLEDFQSIGDQKTDWVSSDAKIRVAEYFYKDYREQEIVLLSTGISVVKEDLPKHLLPNVTVVRERTSKIPVIRWVKMTGSEVLEKRDWIGRFIPIVPVYGNEIDVNGLRILEGIVRHAKDSQRMYNYWASSETETIALAPRAPYIGVEGQFEGFEGQWREANRKNHAFLQYRNVSVGGQPANPPQRQVYEPPVAAITNARKEAAEDLKATTGIYDATLGNRSNETSGRAIIARNSQAQTSNFHFIDNLSRSLRHAGRILIDLIPKIYDTPRSIRIVHPDNQHEVVEINKIFQNGGKNVIYNLALGKYDVTVETGPSYATKREEAVNAMLEFTAKYPEIAKVAGDLMVKNMDWPGAQEISERLRKMLPPNITDDGKDKQPLPPQVTAQLRQMSQMIGDLTKQLNLVHDERDKKVLEIESRERIEMKKLQVEVEIALAKLGSTERIEMLNQEVSRIENRMDLLRENSPVEDDPILSEQQNGPQTGPQNLSPAGPNGVLPGANPNPTGGTPPGLPMNGVNS